MKIKKTEKDGITVLAIKGEVTINTSPELRRTFEELYDSGARKIVVDFEKVPYIDSSGLSVLIEMLQRFRQNGGAIALANMIDKIKYLFEIAKMDMLMSIYESQQEAIASL